MSIGCGCATAAGVTRVTGHGYARRYQAIPTSHIRWLTGASCASTGTALPEKHRNATALLEGFPSDDVIADKGDDAEAFVEALKQAGLLPGSPLRRNRQTPRHYDTHWYQARNWVERLFPKLRHYRRIAVTHMTMLALASTIIWLN